MDGFAVIVLSFRISGDFSMSLSFRIWGDFPSFRLLGFWGIFHHKMNYN